MTEAQILQSYRLSISRNPRNVNQARQNVYYSLNNLYGRHWLGIHSERIKKQLEQIEREVSQEGVVHG